MVACGGWGKFDSVFISGDYIFIHFFAFLQAIKPRKKIREVQKWNTKSSRQPYHVHSNNGTVLSNIVTEEEWKCYGWKKSMEMCGYKVI